MKTKTSIRTKLIFSFLLLTVIIAVSLVCFNRFFTRSFFLNKKSEIMIEAFECISQSDISDTLALQETAEEYRDANGLLITAFDQDGNCIYSSVPRGRVVEGGEDSEHGREGMIIIPEKREGEFGDYVFVETEYSEHPQTAMLRIDSKGREIMCLKGKAEISGNTVYIMITHPMKILENNYSEFSKLGITMMVASLLIAVVMSVIISRSISNPVIEINEISKKIARLDFSERANENNTSKEVSDLAISINEMSDKMKGYISDLTKANEALKKDIDNRKRLEKMRKEFIANVSHEMKTPLSLLQIYVENLKSDVDGIDKEYYCDTIVEEVDSLNQMVKSMLDISSIESGTLDMELVYMNFSELCESVLEKYGKGFENFEFQGNIEEGVFIDGSPKYLEQAISNFMNNGMRYTQDGGIIRLELHSDGDRCRLSVYNQGSSIDEEDMEQLWDAFYRGDKARTRDDLKNVGLGLYIVKTVVEKHGGSCGARNCEGGVEFSFEIPLASEG